MIDGILKAAAYVRSCPRKSARVFRTSLIARRNGGLKSALPKTSLPLRVCCSRQGSRMRLDVMIQ